MQGTLNLCRDLERDVRVYAEDIEPEAPHNKGGLRLAARDTKDQTASQILDAAHQWLVHRATRNSRA